MEQYEFKADHQSLANVLDKTLEYSESNWIIAVVTDYAYALDTLDRYDYQKLEIENTTNREQFKATYDNAIVSKISAVFSCIDKYFINFVVS